ncbi:MAG: hypothetical protein IPL53_07860 [Ignavibacteria bacterium]|nr:hypothetical protein [Ignavibacteria bacterium]
MLRFAKVFGMIYRRFLDLQKAEAQAREAQIELALERVRARTMAMQRSDELEETSQILFQQFKELGEHPDRITIGTINEPEREIELWVTVEGFQNRMVRVSIDEPNVIHKIYTAWKKQKKSILIDIKGKELRDYITYRKSFGNDQGIGEFLKDRMIVYVAFFSKGIISITTPELLPRESIQLLERFAGVFDLTYTRFLDLQKAEEQAREALIEVALERVRSRTMAMHKSEELAETAAVLFQQLCGLGIDALRLYIGIIDEKRDEIEFWTTDYGGSQISSKYKANLYGSTTFRKMYIGWKEKQKSTIVDPKGKELTEHLYYLKEIMNYPIRNRKTLSRRLQTIAYFSKGLIGVLSNNELPVESINVLERFAGVFDLTYRRFLDLQTSEAQTKEAQIEVALERVRSRTMAMHSSDELQEAAILLFQQIKELGVDTGSCGYVIWENENKDATVWMSSAEGGFQESFRLPHTKSKIYKEIYSAKEEGKEFFVKEVRGSELKKHFDYLTTVPGIGEKIKQLRKARYKFPETIVYNTAFFKQGYLSFHTHEQLPDAHDIFRRFANVFEQTYTRFLDLQKAEAQAREAQIEAGLERVRAKSMAMHSSDDVSSAIVTLFTELEKLGIENLRCGIAIIKNNKNMDVWSVTNVDDGKTVKAAGSFDMNAHKLWKIFYDSWKKNSLFLHYYLSGKEKRDYIKILNNAPNYLSQPIIDPPDMDFQSYHFKEGAIWTFSMRPHDDQVQKVMKRFTAVFSQTFRRYRDLQKAEAQAREAQIELGLERVRTRAMAMQKSDELSELVDTVFKELTKLDFALTWCIINIIDESSMSNTVWAANPDINKAPESYHMFFEDYPFHHAMMKGWKERKAKAVYVLGGLEKKVYDDYLFNDTEFRRVPAAAQTVSRAMEKYVVTFSFSNFGGLQTVGDEPLSEANIDILSRFGKVFDLTYTRFNDLKLAEAQAAEAKIEAALERVRSRTMGMQKSEELKEVIQVVLEQFVHLNINAEHAGFVMDYKARHDYNIWVADPLGVPSQITIPYFDSVYYNQFNEAKEKGMDFFATNLNFREKNKFYKKLFMYIPGLPEEAKEFYFNCPGLAASTVLLDNVSLYIENFSGTPYSNEENATLMRFGKVFQQTCTRFLDLQKAEAQAREAKIETALERVRSQSMGMQTSKDLSNVTTAMFEQLRMLGGELYATGIVFCDKHKHHVEQWHSVPEAGMLSPFIVPVDLDYIHQYRYDQWKKGVELFSVEIPGDFIAQHFEAMFSLPTVKAVLDDFAAKNIAMPETPNWEIDYGASFRHGYLLVSALQPFSNADILPRFAKVFEQTYTRFLDLQKAEAQAREAQVESALEKVRSRSLAMHKADELGEVITVVVDKLKELDFSVSDGVALITYSEDSKDLLEWMANPGFPSALKFHVPYFEHPVLANLWKAKNEGKEFIMERYTKEENKSFLNHIFEHSDFKHTPQPIKDYCLAAETYATSIAFQTNTSIFINDYSGKSLSEQEIDILKRFSKVFEQAYVRFLDLQKAEAQAREAQIEAALEKVRGKAMAMHNSNDLTDAAGQVFTELNNLGIKPIRSGFVLLTKESRKAKLYPATSFDNKNTISFTGEFEFTGHPVYEKQYESWQRKENYFPVLEGDILKSYYKILAKGLSVSYKNFLTKNKKQFGTFLPFKEGFLFTWSDEPYSEKEINILDRFKGILDLTIRRYLDLQKAEAQAREARIEAALERARTQSMLMKHSNELNITSQIFHEQLQLLGIDSEFSFVWLPDEENRDHLFWAAWSENKNGSVIVQSKSVTYPLDKTERYTAECFKAWESNDPIHEYFVSPEEINNFLLHGLNSLAEQSI